MTAATDARPDHRSGVLRGYDGRGFMGPGLAACYVGLIVLIPIAALIWQSFAAGLGSFVSAITSPQAIAAITLTFVMSAIVVAVNAVMGTLIAWVLVRDVMLRSKVDGLAREAGFTTRHFPDANGLVAALAGTEAAEASLVVLDVSDRAGEGLVALERIAKSRGAVPTLAFYAHTDHETRARAMALGVTRIVPRSAFVLRFGELARELAGAS